MKYRVGLNAKQMYDLAEKLEKYAEDFETKVQTFLERLADHGIEVARANGGIFGNYIVYSKKLEGSTVYIMASDSTLITNSWYVSSKSNETRQETINPLLMAEFGSGHYAIEAKGEAAGLGGTRIYS